MLGVQSGIIMDTIGDLRMEKGVYYFTTVVMKGIPYLYTVQFRYVG